MRSGLVRRFSLLALGGFAAVAPAQCPPVTLSVPSPALGDQFGQSVSLDGDYAVIGAWRKNIAGFQSGAAYAYERQGSGWSAGIPLNPAGLVPGLGYGVTTALDGDVAVIGGTSASGGGAAWVFRRTGAGWQEESQLIPNDPSSNASYGASVAVEGDIAVVGAPTSSGNGAAYVFERIGGVWTQRAKLVSILPVANEELGRAVAISGDTIAAGARAADVQGVLDAGAVYVFRGSGTNWPEEARLTVAGGLTLDYFGASVALDGDVLVAGAIGRGPGAGIADDGEAYVFHRSGTVWTDWQPLAPPGIAAGAIFGQSVAVLGDRIVVGAPFDIAIGGFNRGAAHVFTFDGVNWDRTAKLPSTNNSGLERFATDVALHAEHILVGAPLSGTFNNSGAAYVLDADAQEVPFELDSVQTFADITVTVPMIGTFTFHVPVTGSFTGRVTGQCGQPGTFQVIEGTVSPLSAVVAKLGPGVSITVENALMSLGGGAGNPGAPSTIGAGGAFTQQVQYAASGVGTWDVPGAQGTLNLATLPPGAVSFQGTLGTTGGKRTIAGLIPKQTQVLDIGLGSLNPSLGVEGEGSADEVGPCYADCNASGTLTVADFGCFQGRYVLGDLYADCNGSGTLTVADFGCYQGQYVLGCP
ncbi:MAG: hypothetical protein ACKVU4_01540 [Phycisphaerales bacterium]